MAQSNGHTAEHVLLVGCMAAVELWQSETGALRAQNVLVRAEMADRIIDGAALLDPHSFTRAILILPSSQGQDILGALIPYLATALASQAEILVRAAPEQLPALAALLTQGGFADARVTGSTVTAKPPPTAGSSSLKRSLEETLATPDASTSVPLRLRKNGVSAAKKASLWAFTKAPTNGSATPTIDESTLLTEEDLERREAIQRPDCDVKRTRKACKNCSCGLRELLLQEQDDLPSSLASNGTSVATTNGTPGVKTINTGVVTSSCGNCSLGDAFRCASCPYIGLPAFEAGQKVEVPLGFGDDF